MTTEKPTPDCLDLQTDEVAVANLLREYVTLWLAEDDESLAKSLGYSGKRDPYMQGCRHGIGNTVKHLFGLEFQDKFCALGYELRVSGKP